MCFKQWWDAYGFAFCRDGMIKRAGNENYLRKLVEEERRMYCEGLELREDGITEPSTN